MKRFTTGVLTIGFFFFPFFTFANGGNIRLAEGKYLVNISSSPVTPIAGQKTAMLISFAEISTNMPVTQPLKSWIEIRKKTNQEKVFPSVEYPVDGGILEFAFIYPEQGLYELFIRFEKSDEPGKIYESEDFLVDVQAPREERTNFSPIFIGAAFFLGGLSGFSLRRLPIKRIW